MKVLIACEYTGTVRDAFLARGHDAMSCDLLPTESPGPHYQGSVFDILDDGWDMMIAHPPCTYLTGANGDKNWKCADRFVEMFAALRFFEKLFEADIPKICVENPQCLKILTARVGKRSQEIHPWMFGDMEQKRTWLWLKGLPLLWQTNNVYEPTMRLPLKERQWRRYLPPKDRGKLRSAFFSGAANAMAEQWGQL